MFETFGRERLKLVSNDKIAEKKKFSTQLAFEFPESPQFILLMESNFQKEGFFSALIEKFKPCIIFDTRTAPRLDFIANSRLQAFKKLHENNVTYVDLHYALEKSTYKESVLDYEWLNSAISVVDGLSSKLGPYLFIFDNDIILHGSKKYIPEKFIKAGILSKTPPLVSNEFVL